MLLQALLLQAFYGIRSERRLVERLEFDMPFRWFVEPGVDNPVWDASTFLKNRDRLLAHSPRIWASGLAFWSRPAQSGKRVPKRASKDS